MEELRKYLGAIVLGLALNWVGSACSLLYASEDTAAEGGNGRCAGFAPLRDDFAGDVLDPKWSYYDEKDADGEAPVGEEGLVFDYEMPTTSNTLKMTSRFSHDLRDRAFTVEFAEFAENVTTSIELATSSANLVPNAKITYNGGLEFYVDVMSRKEVESLPNHRFWRIREASVGEERTLFFETGTAEDDMQVRYETISFGSFDPSHLVASISQSPTDFAMGSTVIRGVNLEDAPTDYCPTKSLVDSFAAEELDPRWLATGLPEVCTIETSGALHLTSTGFNKSCGVRSYQAFNLGKSQIEVKLDSTMGLINGASLTLILRSSLDDRIELRVDSQVARSSVWIAGDQTPSDDVPLAGMSLLRIRHDSEAEQIVWEVEHSAGVKVIEKQPLPPFELNGLEVEISLYSGSASASESVDVSVFGINAD